MTGLLGPRVYCHACYYECIHPHTLSELFFGTWGPHTCSIPDPGMPVQLILLQSGKYHSRRPEAQINGTTAELSSLYMQENELTHHYKIVLSLDFMKRLQRTLQK